MTKHIISTNDAPAAIGPYSQAVRVHSGHLLFTSGQIGLSPAGELQTGLEAQLEQIFANLKALASAAGGSLEHAVRLTIYITDMANFPRVNEAMARHVPKPYPSRVTIGVASLPKDALVEIEAILALPH